MPRVTSDDDQREWIVTPQVHLSEAQTHLGQAEFSDALLRAVSLGMSVVLFVAVLFSVPNEFWAPTVVYGPLLLATGMFMLWWAWRRPWSVTAMPADSDDYSDAQVRWVRGPWEALQAYQDTVEEHSSGNERSLVAARGHSEAQGRYEDDWDESTDDPAYPEYPNHERTAELADGSEYQGIARDEHAPDGEGEPKDGFVGN